MTQYARQAYAEQARARIQALWRTRHQTPAARARLHYWVRVLRMTSPTPRKETP